MIVNPGVNAYPLSEKEIERLEEGLGKIFCNPEFRCLLKYGVGGKYKEGISDIDLLALSERTVTDKQILCRMGEEIRELYESFGEKGGIPRGVDPELHIYDVTTFSKGFAMFERSFAELFESGKSKVLSGVYPKGIKISKDADRGIMYTSRNISRLRQFPLLKGIILRFCDKKELYNDKYEDLIKIVDLPYAVFSYLNEGKPAPSKEKALEHVENIFRGISHNPLRALLEAKKSFDKKMEFLDAEDNLLLDGITWYEQVISELFSRYPPS